MASSEGAHYSSTYGLSYSDVSILNTVDVHLPRKRPAAGHGFWIVFIHGGAWRDPRQTSRDFDPAVVHLSPMKYPIAGIASINYRLSPAPRLPAPLDSDTAKARSARHPMHIEDVLTAVVWLQGHYAFKNNYLLAGHSAGATLAFQAVMGTWSVPAPLPMPPPVGIVGLCGIYDLSLLVRTHASISAYREFVEQAFGTNEAQWAPASPVSGRYSTSWPAGRAAVIAHSKDDELVDFPQTEAMSDRLWAEKRTGRRDIVISLRGKHQEVMDEGTEVARALLKCLELVSS